MQDPMIIKFVDSGRTLSFILKFYLQYSWTTLELGTDMRIEMEMEVIERSIPTTNNLEHARVVEVIF